MVFQCEICPATYKLKCDLMRHVRENHGDKSFVCEHCSRTYKTKRAMDQHVATVHGEKGFECSTCGKKFNTKSSMTRHLQTHTREKSYRCPACNEGFSTTIQLKSHHTAVHARKRKPTTIEDTPPVTKRPRKEPTVVTEDDPALFQANLVDDIALRPLYQQHWNDIRTKHKTNRKLLDTYNFRLLPADGVAVIEKLVREVFLKQTTAFKINLSFGCVLQNPETKEYRYYYSCSNNNCIIEEPVMISTKEDLERYLPSITETDILEMARHRRPDSKWTVVAITNITIYVNKIINHPIGAAVVLPEYLMKNHGVNALVKDKGNSTPFDDNLCLIRCYALHLGQAISCLERMTKQLFNQYTNERGIEQRYFRGVTLNSLLEFEDLFKVNVMVYSLTEDENKRCVAKLEWRSMELHDNTMNLNLHERHFSYINDMGKYAHSYRCRNCDAFFDRSGNLKAHMKTCSTDIKEKFPGGAYHPKATVFEDLDDIGITVPEDDRCYRHFTTFDFETATIESDEEQHAPKLKWIGHHAPASVSVCASVPGFTASKCFVNAGDDKQMIDDFLEYLLETSNESYTLLIAKFKFKFVFDALQKRIATELVRGDGESIEEFQARRKKFYLVKLMERFYDYLRELPVFGFNSGRYDINVIKDLFFPLLLEKQKLKYPIKRNNDYLCLTTSALKFMDITNFLAPGFSYATFLKAYGVSEAKGFFPYDWFSLDKLDDTCLPPHSTFYNQLKSSNITDEEYSYCQEVWRTEGMKTFRDFLIWYNNKDVIGFVEAVDKMISFYHTKGLDMVKDGVSVPGLTLKYLFKTVEEGTFFTLFNDKNKDLLKTIKENIVGGPSIVFHRYQEKGVTKIREAEFGEDAKTTGSTLGYDANALYLYALMQMMPSGVPVRRRADNDFRPETQGGFRSYEWMVWYGHLHGVEIRHQYNNTEKRIGSRQVSVDGWIPGTKTILQFDGCYYHGCPCVKNPKANAAELLQKTLDNTSYLEAEGFTVIRMKECDWVRERKDPEIDAFLNTNLRKPFSRKRKMTQKQVLAAIKNGQIFGLVECDISTPEALKHTFCDLPPIFKNTEITRDDIGDFMKDFAEEKGIMNQPRRSLISSYFGEKILLSTPLLQWYLSHGLEVTHIYQVVQYDPKKAFKNFGELVSDARRDGDVDPAFIIIAETMKLIGNSSYGKLVTNIEKHRDVKYLNHTKASRAINKSRFRALNPVTEDVYEVTMAKGTLCFDLPTHVGFFVYQNAKLRMLEFIFDFLNKYIAPEDFQPCQMDTDSYYLSISGESLDDVIRPELREQYNAEKDQWFPRPDHMAYDKRTPGLFKLEYSGTGIVSLCSKTYYCWGQTDKYSTKGLNKYQNDISKDRLMEVLNSKVSSGGTNRGFRVRGNKMWTYTQERDALSYFYPKRKVLADGKSTEPLDI